MASAPNYGKGSAGARGIPTLTASAAPVFRSNINLLVSNSSGAASSAMVLVGSQRASISFLGGSLLVNPILQVGVPMPGGGLVLPVTLPDLSASCGTAPRGLEFFVQVLQLDNGAPMGVSMTPGLRLLLGN